MCEIAKGGAEVINSVSTVSFKGVGVMDKVSQEQLYNPGLYALPELLNPPPPVYKKRGGFLNFLAKVLFMAVVAGGIAIGIRKVLMNDYKVVEKLADKATSVEKIKNSFAKYTDKLYDNTVVRFADWVDKTKSKK